MNCTVNHIKYAVFSLISCAALLTTGATTAHGVCDVSDLRIGLGGYGITNSSWAESYRAGTYSTTGSGNDSGTGEAHSVGAFSIIYTQGRLPSGGGLVWAAGIETTTETHHSDVVGFANQPVSTSTFTFLGRIGFGVPFGSRIHLEIMPELHLGGLVTDVYDTDSISLEGSTADGAYGAAGLHLGGYVRVVHRLVLGLSLGMRRTAGQYSGHFHSTGGVVEGSLYSTQWGGQLQMGVRF